jgi:hypothetical protein
MAEERKRADQGLQRHGKPTRTHWKLARAILRKAKIAIK